MYKVVSTKQYKKDLKHIADNHKLVYEIDDVVTLLATNDIPLPKKYKDHALKGNYNGFRECHIRPNWLLVYKKDKEELILALVRIGSHSDLF